MFFHHFFVFVKNFFKSLLHFLFKWSVYRNLKNGLLLDYYIKSFYISALYSLFLIYSLFFNDKFFLEIIPFRLSVLYTYLNKYILNLSQSNILKIIKCIIIIFLYFSLIYAIIFI